MPGYGSVCTSIERSRPSAATRSDAVADRQLEAHVGEAGEQVLHVLGPGVADRQLAAGDGDRGEVGRGLDAVGHGAVVGRAQRARARRRARRAVDVPMPAMSAPIVDEHLAEVDDLGLAGRVVDRRHAVGEHRRGDDVLGRPDARERRT